MPGTRLTAAGSAREIASFSGRSATVTSAPVASPSPAATVTVPRSAVSTLASPPATESTRPSNRLIEPMKSATKRFLGNS